MIGLFEKGEGGSVAGVLRKREGVEMGRREKTAKELGVTPGLPGQGQAFRFNCVHKGTYL